MNEVFYIGSDKELLENGFRLVHDYEVYAIRNNGTCNTFINNKKEVVYWNEKHIEDLLDKKLVVKRDDKR